MLAEIEQKSERLAVGLMSGTSADGIDVALVKIEGGGIDAVITLIAHDTLHYSAQVRARILACQGPRAGTLLEITLLDAYLGELFAHAVLHICKKAGLRTEEVDLVGSHGQTLYHHPAPEKMPGFTVTGTLQVANPAIIAERTGLTVVSGFRSRDMAAGGQGAPLVPYLDYILYRHRARSRLALNIGGIANVTSIPADSPIESVVAFDTGPGNCLLDLAAARYSKGQIAFDKDGAWERQGHVDESLLARLLEHPFLQKAPPKSADKEEFGAAYLDKLLAENPGKTPYDMMATLAAFTVRSLAGAIMEHLLRKERYEELIVSGGGSHNPVLMEGIRQAFPKIFISSADDYSIPSKAKEAVLMAFLANETVLGHPGNIPTATGAKAPVILGSITPSPASYKEPSGQGRPQLGIL
jgi:anhydro-N-acetylmuramic acid kinase